MPDVRISCRTAPFGDPGSSPLDGVVVSLHPNGGGATIAAGTTGANGNAPGTVFLGALNAGTYEVHVTPPLGAAIVQEGNLHTITVDAVNASQVFDVLVDVSGLPAASDDNFCRCSGTFMDSYGKPVSDLSIHFYENTVPELAYYPGTNTVNAIIPKPQVIRTDSSGYAVVDLLQGATYQVYMEGFENLSRAIDVPALSASSLPDVIFPVVDGVEYTYNNALLPVNAPVLSIGVGQQAVLSLETVHRSGLRVDGLVAVSLTSDDVDEAIIQTDIDSNTLTVTAIGAGNTLLQVAREVPEEGMGISISPVPALRGTLSVIVT